MRNENGPNHLSYATDFNQINKKREINIKQMWSYLSLDKVHPQTRRGVHQGVRIDDQVFHLAMTGALCPCGIPYREDESF